MNIGEPTVLIKTKDTTVGGEINTVVPTLCHLVYLIGVILVEVGGIEPS
jgi:hypothetical protein